MPLWYKGTPGKYDTTLATEELSSSRLLQIRDDLEHQYKRRELLK